jgi:glutamate synthase (NADPH/NADH) large chain
MGHPLRYDAERVRVLLERHQLATGSRKAAELLADWPKALQNFVKVVPNEYRRALSELDPELRAVAAE